ncbi:Chitin synthase, class 2 [Ceratobasidium sp. 392]|nr:Chitin synthase, class 2 [Ceratobasidium sp. 392]
MYNEDEVLFVKAMNAVIKSVAYLCQRTKSKTWGPEGWKKDGIAKDEVAGKDVMAHILEHTSAVVLPETGRVAQNPTSVQTLFCLKEQNKRN